MAVIGYKVDVELKHFIVGILNDFWVIKRDKILRVKAANIFLLIGCDNFSSFWELNGKPTFI